MPYTSSDISRFPAMLLFPILSESGKAGRLEVFRLELRSPLGTIRSVRTMAHGSPAHSSPVGGFLIGIGSPAHRLRVG
jgi:hypothetical protein